MRSSDSNQAFRLVLLLGLVSLTADMVYEGARSITGPYLLILGASATTIGLVAGVGEVAAYGSRIAFGYFADKSGKHWSLVVTGYMMVLSLPALALVNRLDIASILIILERLGKAIRTPARDAIIANVTSSMGRGRGFGIHEAIDQVGAVAGPVFVAALLYYRGDNYNDALLHLFIPAIAMGSLLLYISRSSYKPTLAHTHRDTSFKAPVGSIPRVFWLYLAFVSTGVAGYAHFQLISYHMKLTSVIDDAHIPLLFALAMGVDALVALMVGHLFDRKGFAVLALIPLTSVAIAPLAFSPNPTHIVAGILLWGALMGMQETIMRASIAGMVDRARLATAYGLFNCMHGIAWFSGSIVMGMLYDSSIANVVIFSVTLSIISSLLLLMMLKSVRL